MTAAQHDYWYSVVSWSERIKPVIVDKYTAKSVWVDGARVARLSEYYSYFPSWEAAHTHLLKTAVFDLATQHRRVDQARSRLETVKAMKPPNGETK